MPGMSKSARNPTVMMLNQIEIHPPTWWKKGIFLIKKIILKSCAPLPRQLGSRCPWQAPWRLAWRRRSSCSPSTAGCRRTPWLLWESQTVWSQWRWDWERGRRQPHWGEGRPGTPWAAPWRRRQPWPPGWRRWCWPRWPRCQGCSPSSAWGTVCQRRSRSGWPPGEIKDILRKRQKMRQRTIIAVQAMTTPCGTEQPMAMSQDSLVRTTLNNQR